MSCSATGGPSKEIYSPAIPTVAPCRAWVLWPPAAILPVVLRGAWLTSPSRASTSLGAQRGLWVSWVLGRDSPYWVLCCGMGPCLSWHRWLSHVGPSVLSCGQLCAGPRHSCRYLGLLRLRFPVLGFWAWPGHGAFCSSKTQHHQHRQWHTGTSHVPPHTLTCTSTHTHSVPPHALSCSSIHCHPHVPWHTTHRLRCCSSAFMGHMPRQRES